MYKWTAIFLVLLVVGVFSQAQDSPSEEQQYASMRRTACLVLSRYHSNEHKSTIEGIVQGLTPEHQQAYINKIYATGVETCEPIINQSEVQELFVENPEFDPSHLFHLFESVNYETAANNLDKPLTPNQEAIVKFMKNFDAEMAVKREQKEAEQGVDGAANPNEIKMFGIAFGNLSNQIKFVYASIFFVIIAGFLYYGFTKLDDKKDSKKSKRRKSPTKRD